MRFLTQTDFYAFVAAKLAAAIHFDAEWNISYQDSIRRKVKEAEQALGEHVSFGEVGCDRNPKLANSIYVLNVPLVAYYHNGKLVESRIGIDQDVRKNLERILRL
jgi:thioredoxin-like negative regulator of GroEL